ncbi:MAG: NIPSNAP family protein [Limisphaerales bacterium]
MKRREFLTSSIATAGLGALLAGSAADAQETASPAVREFYELRLYHLRRGPQTELFDHFYSQAAIPALNRAGVDRVGVFNLAVGPDSPTMYVLLAHKSLESVAAMADRLAADADYLKAGAEFLDAPATNPAYLRVESSLMAAFAGMPKLEVPANKSRLFELRTYESHSKKANKKKIEMFEHGEIAIFRRNGVQPVFFGETLIGPRLPNLTYMVVFENPAAHDKNWAAFMADPEWAKLRTTPGYADADIVSNISNVFLRPASYSQN